MPRENRRCAAVRAPAFGQFARQLFVRAGIEAKDFVQSGLNRQIAGWPNVGAAFGEQQVDFG